MIRTINDNNESMPDGRVIITRHGKVSFLPIEETDIEVFPEGNATQ
jgi:hypothetical protein